MISPGINLDAPAQRECCDLVKPSRFQLRRRGEQGRHPYALSARQVVPQMRTNQVGQIRSLLLESAQEQTGTRQLVFIRRVFQQFERLGVGRFLVSAASLEV